MATHSSVLSWRIPGIGEPGGLLSMGSHRVGHDWSDLAAAAAVPMHKTSIHINAKLSFYPIQTLHFRDGKTKTRIGKAFARFEGAHLCVRNLFVFYPGWQPVAEFWWPLYWSFFTDIIFTTFVSWEPDFSSVCIISKEFGIKHENEMGYYKT